MLNTGLQLCWEMQQNAKMSSDPTANIQYNSQRKTKQLASSTALFGNGFSPKSPTSAHLELPPPCSAPPWAGIWVWALAGWAPADTRSCWHRQSSSWHWHHHQQHKMCSSALSLAYIPVRLWWARKKPPSKPSKPSAMASVVWGGKAENKKGH